MSSRAMFQRQWSLLAALLLLSALGVSVALADDADPPDRVARLSFTAGSVSLEPAGAQDWADATVNRPLTTGDKVWSDQDSRAEVDMGSAVIRLGSNTGFSFLNLDDQAAQLNVTAGTAIVHVRDLGQGRSFEIDTPNVAVTVQSPGNYRVQVNDAGDSTVVKVSNGEAEVIATGQTVPVHTQQAYTFVGTNQVTVDAGSVGSPDALDEWSLDRDHQLAQAQEQLGDYVSPDVAGADDLANYGTWQTTPDYGPVWTPTSVAADWAPYQYGRWMWVGPWGWTWVDAAPWGFTPFHYGRWAYIGNRWGWVPGPRRVRPVYAPALVAWVGSPVAGVAIAGGVGAAVGWFALGPHEVYVPGYRVSNNYVRNVNISNTTIVNNTYITNVYENRVNNITYVNRDRPGAVVTVPQTVFTSAQAVHGHTTRIPPGELARFGAHGAAPAIAPVRASVLGHETETNVRRPPAAFANRPIVARVAPPPAPVSFERQQQAIRANGNRPLARSQLAEMQPRAPNPTVRVVTPGPVRPIQNNNRPGAERSNQGGIPGSTTPVRPGTASRPNVAEPQPGRQGGGNQENLRERERALHTTPITPQNQTAPRPDRPNGVDRPAGIDRPTAPAMRNDRPPQNQLRQNDQFRPQNNDAGRRPMQDARPVPEAHPTPQARPVPEANPAPQARPRTEARPMPQDRPMPDTRPVPQARPMPEARPLPQDRPMPETRSIPQDRAMPDTRSMPQARPMPEARPMPQARPEPVAPVERAPSAPTFRAPDPVRAPPEQRAIEQPRREARPIEQPRVEQPRVEQPRVEQRPIEQLRPAPQQRPPAPQPPQPATRAERGKPNAPEPPRK